MFKEHFAPICYNDNQIAANTKFYENFMERNRNIFMQFRSNEGISVSSDIELGKSDKFCSEALISA